MHIKHKQHFAYTPETNIDGLYCCNCNCKFITNILFLALTDCIFGILPQKYLLH